ncbi:hypothetical protein RB195_008032 [Necator americanus]|uniref:Uncharacterized protein n=1 Tax=Necator americanus TaxID=51031 RepID=A0ABR1C187_NECAM
MDGKSETFTSGISNEDDDNDQPFAVTESLIKSLESADNEVTMPIRTEKVLTTLSDQYAKHPVNTFIESTDGTYLSSTVRPTTTSTFDNELTSVPSVPAHRIQDSIFSESSTPPHEVPTAKKKKKNDTVYGLNKSEFQGYLYLTDVGDPTNEWTGELSNDNFPESVVSFDQGSAVEEHSDRSGDLHVEDVVVAPRENAAAHAYLRLPYRTAGVCPQAKVLPDDDVDDSWRCTDSLDKWLSMKTTLNRRRRRCAAARHIQQRLDMGSAARHGLSGEA